MEEFLNEYFIDDNEIAALAHGLDAKLEAALAAPDRLRGAVQLITLMDSCKRAFDKIDRTDFVSALNQEIDLARDNADTLLRERAADVRSRIDHTMQMASELRAGMNARGRCINETLEALHAAGADADQLRHLSEEANGAMQSMEEILARLADLRRQQPFAELCRMAEGADSEQSSEG